MKPFVSNSKQTVFANPISHTFDITRIEQRAVTANLNLNLSAQKTSSGAKRVRNRVYKNTPITKNPEIKILKIKYP